jgi:hypothetical protein
MLKSVIGVYETHDAAIEALQELRNAHYPLKNISLLGNAYRDEDKMELKPNILKDIGFKIGLLSGVALSFLTGVGIFLVPGFGFLYAAGAAVALAAGLGVMSQGLAALWTAYGVQTEDAARYDQHLKEGRWMLVAEGEDSQVKKARQVLEAHAKHMHLGSH